MRTLGIEIAGSVGAPPPPSRPRPGTPPRAFSLTGDGGGPAVTVPCVPAPGSGATRSGSALHSPSPPVSGGIPVAADVARTVLSALQDQEEGVERRLALSAAAVQQEAEGRAAMPLASRTRGRNRQRDTGRGPSGAVSVVGIKPEFEFASVPSGPSLAANKDTFESAFMRNTVSTWPQTLATFKRRRLNDGGGDCSGAVEGAALGTNASIKTWGTRIRVACAFADFLARTVCWHPGDPRPSDEERDRGVIKFFRCQSPFTIRVIIAFLRSRKNGDAVAGGGRSAGVRGKPPTAVTLTDYTNGLTFLFGEAKIDGPHGNTPLVFDCATRNSPWQAKGQAELENELKT